MKYLMSVIAALVLGASPVLADTPKAAVESGRPGAVLNDAECAEIWNEASANGNLDAEAARPFVANFPQVDTNDDNTISNEEFKQGCEMGFVQRADAGSDAGTGAGTGTEGNR